MYPTQVVDAIHQVLEPGDLDPSFPRHRGTRPGLDVRYGLKQPWRITRLAVMNIS